MIFRIKSARFLVSIVGGTRIACIKSWVVGPLLLLLVFYSILRIYEKKKKKKKKE
jgi:hypothetical protein